MVRFARCHALQSCRRAAAVALSIAGTLSGPSAFAQELPSDNWHGGGSFLRSRGYVLKPAVAAEAGFDSNFAQASGRQEGGVNEPVVPSVRMRLTPSLELRPTAGRSAGQARRLDLRARAAVSHNEFIAANDGSERLERFLGADLGMRLNLLPHRPWSGELSAEYRTTKQPAGAFAAFRDGTYRSHNILADTALRWRPGGGLLTWRAHYRFNGVIFEDSSGTALSGLNRLQHDFALDGQWLFLPRTSLFYDGALGVIRYPRDGSGVKRDGAAFHSKVGLSGLLTRMIRLKAAAGYKALFFEDDLPASELAASLDPPSRSMVDRPVWDLQVTFSPQGRPEAPSAVVGLAEVSLGYVRDVQPAFLGDYVASHRVDLTGMYALARVVTVRAEAAWLRFERPASFFSDGSARSEAFSENRARFGASAEYRATAGLGITAKLGYSTSLSDRMIPLGQALGAVDWLDDLGFNRLETWAGVVWSP